MIVVVFVVGIGGNKAGAWKLPDLSFKQDVKDDHTKLDVEGYLEEDMKSEIE